MEIENMDEAQLQALAEQIQSRINFLAQQRVTSHENMRIYVHSAISTMKTLLGPENAPSPSMDDLLAGNTSIRGLLNFTPEEIQSHSGLAVTLILKGLEILTETQINLAELETRRG